MGEPVVEVKDLSVIFNIANERIQSLKEWVIKVARRELFYKEFVAVDNVSFTVERGDVFGIIGTNGSGKSTMLKVIAGVLTPSKGTCTVNGTIAPLIELGAGFDGELTAHENIYLNGALLGHSKQFMKEHFDEIVEFAELEGFMEMPIKNYSSGMVARIAFAIATMSEPDLLIVDEVLSVGDFLFQKKCEERINKMIEHGTTVLIVSHNNDQIRRLCTKTLWIEKSKMKMIGDTAEVLDAYESMMYRNANGIDDEEAQAEAEGHELSMYFNADRYEVARMAAGSVAELRDVPPSGIIVVSGADEVFPEALSAAGLSGVLDYPVVCVNGAGLTEANRATLAAYGTDLDIVIIGDTDAVSEEVQQALADYGTVSARISGADAYEVNAKVFEYGKEHGTWNMEHVFIARGDNFPDSLTVAPYLTSNAAPLVLAPPATEELPAAQAAIVEQAEHVIVLGGPASVSTTVEDAWNATRLSGEDRYETSARIVKWELDHGMSLEGAGFATGTAFVDALSANPLLASAKSVLLLVSDEDGPNAPVYARIKDTEATKFRIFSSTEALHSEIRNSIARAAGWNAFNVSSVK